MVGGFAATFQKGGKGCDSKGSGRSGQRFFLPARTSVAGASAPNAVLGLPKRALLRGPWWQTPLHWLAG